MAIVGVKGLCAAHRAQVCHRSTVDMSVTVAAQWSVIQYDTAPLPVLMPLTHGMAGNGSDPVGGGGGGGGGGTSKDCTAAGWPTSSCCGGGMNAAAVPDIDGGAGVGRT